jgi:hypothetical protein
MKSIKNNSQRGQALVLVALAIIGMLAMLALVLDGGTTFMNRRAMQNAADAGALAGARQLCMTHSEGDAVFVANQYATYWNSAQAATVNADLDARTVVVTATREVNTFFAHFIGQNRIKAQAVAEASCINATVGKGVLPVAWICRAPIRPNEPGDPQDCEADYLTETQLENYKAHPLKDDGTIWPELYIIMDDVSVPNDLDAICQPEGNLVCDLDGDGEDDLMSMGGRSWLDLSGGGGGASELVDWINGENVPDVGAHYWLTGQSGTANSVFQAVGDHVGEIVIIPIFDEICDSDDVVNECDWHEGNPQDVDQTGAGGGLNFHIISFSLFYISCVNAPGVPGQECPGHRYAREIAGTFNNIPGTNVKNPKTIEGYFIKGNVEGLGGDPSNPGGIDTGAYVFYLTR